MRPAGGRHPTGSYTWGFAPKARIDIRSPAGRTAPAQPRARRGEHRSKARGAGEVPPTRATAHRTGYSWHRQCRETAKPRCRYGRSHGDFGHPRGPGVPVVKADPQGPEAPAAPVNPYRPGNRPHLYSIRIAAPRWTNRSKNRGDGTIPPTCTS